MNDKVILFVVCSTKLQNNCMMSLNLLIMPKSYESIQQQLQFMHLFKQFHLSKHSNWPCFVVTV